jgi:hypothetical protein
MLRVRFCLRYQRPAILVLLLGTLVLPILTLITKSLIPVVAAPQVEPNALLGVRQFYLSRTEAQGNEALSACANGYHFASLWEIADPSNLRYNRFLGMYRDDSGVGPPSTTGITPGWVRTGYSSSNSSTAGEGNCNGWMSQSSGDYGTVAYLPYNWTAGLEDIGVWGVDTWHCDSTNRVWCIEDASVAWVYLPIVLR